MNGRPLGAPLVRWSAIWLAAGLFFASWLLTTHRIENPTTIWDRALLIQFSSFALWALLAWPLLAGARLAPWQRGRRLLALAWRVALAFGFSVSHAALHTALLAATLPRGLFLEGFEAGFQHSIRFNLHFNLLIAALALFADSSLGWYRRLAYQRLQAAQLQARLVQARLSASRLQIQPRFLFDTMAAVRQRLSVAPLDAEQQLLRLADLLRALLERSRHPDSTVREEFEFARSFLALEQARLHERLTFAVELASDALDLELPSLILIPLLDEAIARATHGTRPLHVSVSVETRDDGGVLEIEILAADGAARRSPCLSEEVVTAARERLETLFGTAPSAIEIEDDGGRRALVRLLVPPAAIRSAVFEGALVPREVVWSRS